MISLIFLLSFLNAVIALPEICKQFSIEVGQNIADSDGSGLTKTKACFQQLIQRGQFESIDALQQSLNDDEEKIMEDLMIQEIKRLEAISSYIILSKSTCEPIIKWAQNLTHVFVAVKLSHRWDSPPCLRSIQQNYSLQNQTLLFNNLCIVSNSEIRYYFQHRVYNKTKGSLQAKKDGVGTYVLTFEKQQPLLWLFLLEKAEKIPIWHEIMDRNSTMKKQFQTEHKKMQYANTVPLTPPQSDV